MADELELKRGDKVKVSGDCAYRDLAEGVGGVVVEADYTLPWPLDVKLDGGDYRLFHPSELDRA